MYTCIEGQIYKRVDLELVSKKELIEIIKSYRDRQTVPPVYLGKDGKFKDLKDEDNLPPIEIIESEPHIIKNNGYEHTGNISGKENTVSKEFLSGIDTI